MLFPRVKWLPQAKKLAQKSVRTDFFIRTIWTNRTKKRLIL